MACLPYFLCIFIALLPITIAAPSLHYIYPSKSSPSNHIPSRSQLDVTIREKDSTEQQNASVSTPPPSQSDINNTKPGGGKNNGNVTSTVETDAVADNNSTTSLQQSNNSTSSLSQNNSSLSDTNQTAELSTNGTNHENQKNNTEDYETINNPFQGFFDQRHRIFSGGFIEVIEWLFVFLLVAPGTFPAIGCVLYACTNLAQRRFGSAVASSNTNSNFNFNSNPNLNTNNSTHNNNDSISIRSESDPFFIHQQQPQHHHHHHHSSPSHLARQLQHWNPHSPRNSMLDNGASLTSRTRYKQVPEEPGDL